jgi:hypothetical protein
MSLAEYAQKSIALHAELRQTNRPLAMLVNVLQASAAMALALSAADLINFGIYAESPVRRFAFISIWALAMTGLRTLQPRPIAPSSR